MVFATLRREERIGLGIAVVLHVALGAAFLAQSSKRDVVPPVETMTVNLSSEVGLEAEAPEPVPESRAAVAPVLAPEPAAVAEPTRPVATTRPRPQPVPRATSVPKPRPTQASHDRRRPDTPSKPAGGSRVGDDFLAGAGDSTATRETRVPASKIGASAKASLLQAISNEIRPRWKPPSGPDVDKITTFLRFRLDPDGSLAGRPTVVRQTGVNDTNRSQVGRHEELAIRAVELAAPFDLPEEYYEAWKSVGPLGFNLEL